jgi:hypothetical protein
MVLFSSARGHGEWHLRGNRATQCPGVINTETWSSRPGDGRGADNPYHKKNRRCGTSTEEAKARYGL